MSAPEPNLIGPSDALLGAPAAEHAVSEANTVGRSDALLGTAAAEQAFAAGVIAMAIVIALVAVLALRWTDRDGGGDGDPAEHLRPYSLSVLAMAVAWSAAYALTDLDTSDMLQLFVAFVMVLGVLVGLARRPFGLLVAVGSIVVVPYYAAVIVASGPSEQWTTNEALFGGMLFAALTAIPFLVAFTVTATLTSIARWHSRNTAPSGAGPLL